MPGRKARLSPRRLLQRKPRLPGTPIYEGHTMAELGFIVVQIDGMGTSNRSKKFHDVCCEEPGRRRLP